MRLFKHALSKDAVRNEVTKATDKPLLGIGGDPGVNVLRLNLALDALAPKGALAEKKP
jgi:K+-transporting ATPase c subunit